VNSFNPCNLLTVVFGKPSNQDRFSIHEDIICACFEFFCRAMNGSWIEQAEPIVKLLEDDLKIFATYINIVYTDQLATNQLDNRRRQLSW
jgi:hypothetical protein